MYTSLFIDLIASEQNCVRRGYPYLKAAVIRPPVLKTGRNPAICKIACLMSDNRVYDIIYWFAVAFSRFQSNVFLFPHIAVPCCFWGGVATGLSGTFLVVYNVTRILLRI